MNGLSEKAERGEARVVSPIAVGLDIGTGLTKVATATERVSFPSVVGAPTDLWWGTLSRGPLVENLSTTDSKGEEWFVGHLASKESPVTYYAVRKGRFLNPETASLLIDTALGLVCPPVPGQPINLVVGVPVETGSNTIEEIEEMMRGRHKISLTNESNPVEQRKATPFVERVKVVPSTLGSIIRVDHGVKGIEYEPFTGLVIDIGHGTTSYLAVERMKTVHGASMSHRVAVGSILSHIRKYVVRRTGDLVDVDELSEALIRDSVCIGGDTFDVKQVRDEATERVANHIFLKVQELVHLLPAGSHVVDKEYGKFVLTGGGMHLVGSVLKKLLAAINDRMVSPPDLVFGNAEGLLSATELLR